MLCVQSGNRIYIHTHTATHWTFWMHYQLAYEYMRLHWSKWSHLSAFITLNVRNLSPLYYYIFVLYILYNMIITSVIYYTWRLCDNTNRWGIYHCGCWVCFSTYQSRMISIIYVFNFLLLGARENWNYSCDCQSSCGNCSRTILELGYKSSEKHKNCPPVSQHTHNIVIIIMIGPECVVWIKLLGFITVTRARSEMSTQTRTHTHTHINTNDQRITPKSKINILIRLDIIHKSVCTCVRFAHAYPILLAQILIWVYIYIIWI